MWTKSSRAPLTWKVRPRELDYPVSYSLLEAHGLKAAGASRRSEILTDRALVLILFRTFSL
jgi:hypothetical protein